MKKVYLLVSGLLLTAGAVNAQTTDAKQMAAQKYAQFVKKSAVDRGITTDDRFADDIVWEDDFDGAETWTADGPAADADHGWTISDVTGGWAFPAAGDMGTSGNFARFVNGDPNEAPFPLEDGPFTLTLDGSIDLTGVPAPHIELDQYGARFFTVQQVQVRTGAGEWIVVGDNADIPELTAGGGEAFPQPMARRYNITSAIAADPSDVQIRLFWDGAINGPDMNYIEYGWFVDNIKIVEGHSFDSDIQAAYFAAGVGGDVWAGGLEYYQIPLDQAAETEFFFSAQTINQGALTYEGLHLVATVDEGGEVFSGSSASVDLPSTEGDSLGTTTGFTPTTMADHTITWVFEGDDADTYNDNDMLTAEFEVTDVVYARDNGQTSGAFTNWSDNGGNPFSAGNIFEIFADSEIGAIDVVVNDEGTNVGQQIYGLIQIYDSGSDSYEFLGQTPDHAITSGENGGTIRLHFEDVIELEAGDEILVMAGHYGGSPDVGFRLAQNVVIGVAGYNASNEYRGLADPRAVMVRPVFEFVNFWGVEEEASNSFSVSQNIPNPFGANSVINYELSEAANVSVEFVDVSGKVVSTIDNGTQAAGTYTLDVDANDFAEGVYFYTFTVGTEKVTKRMIITK